MGKERVGRSPVKKPHLIADPISREVMPSSGSGQWQYRHVLWGLSLCRGRCWMKEREDLDMRYDHLGGQQFHD